MKNAILLHGKPSKEQFYNPEFPSSSNYYWLPWLQKQLIIRGIPTATPEVPNNWVAHYPTWQKEFERYEITGETILVGHSCGAGFMLRWLSEHPSVKVQKLVLVAPWINPGKREHSADFFKFVIDDNLADRARISVIYSNDDEPSVLETVKIIKDHFVDATYKELPGYGHFYDSRSMEVPELLQEVLA